MAYKMRRWTGFKPIAGIWQCTRHDHAHGVIEIGFAHLGIYINLLDVSVLSVLSGFFDHIFLCKREYRHKKDTKDEFL